jgi:hypothetical protein
VIGNGNDMSVVYSVSERCLYRHGIVRAGGSCVVAGEYLKLKELDGS